MNIQAEVDTMHVIENIHTYTHILFRPVQSRKSIEDVADVTINTMNSIFSLIDENRGGGVATTRKYKIIGSIEQH